MSELTSYNSERIYWAVEQVEREAGDIDDLHLDDNLFYLKSEADKVIADKDAELRHQKYIRCLDKAALCFEKSYSTTLVKYDKELGNYRNFYDWWGKRWLALAEKFKPNKEQ